MLYETDVEGLPDDEYDFGDCSPVTSGWVPAWLPNSHADAIDAADTPKESFHVCSSPVVPKSPYWDLNITFFGTDCEGANLKPPNHMQAADIGFCALLMTPEVNERIRNEPDFFEKEKYNNQIFVHRHLVLNCHKHAYKRLPRRVQKAKGFKQITFHAQIAGKEKTEYFRDNASLNKRLGQMITQDFGSKVQVVAHAAKNERKFIEGSGWSALAPAFGESHVYDTQRVFKNRVRTNNGSLHREPGLVQLTKEVLKDNTEVHGSANDALMTMKLWVLHMHEYMNGLVPSPV